MFLPFVFVDIYERIYLPRPRGLKPEGLINALCLELRN